MSNKCSVKCKEISIINAPLWLIAILSFVVVSPFAFYQFGLMGIITLGIWFSLLALLTPQKKSVRIQHNCKSKKESIFVLM